MGFIETVRASAVPVYCPKGCGGELDYEPPYKAEQDTNTGAWNGGVTCDTCDFMLEEDDE